MLERDKDFVLELLGSIGLTEIPGFLVMIRY